MTKAAVTHIINGTLAVGIAILGVLMSGYSHAILLAANGYITSHFVSEDAWAIMAGILGNIYVFQISIRG